MADDVPPRPPDELDLLHRMSSRIRAAQPTDQHEVEQALEIGFAAMIGMEAELSRLLRGGSEDIAPGTLDELQRRIAALRDALSELRTLSSPAGESRVGYGFVLPDPRHHGAHAHRH